MNVASYSPIVPLQMGDWMWWGGWWIGVVWMVVWALLLAAVVYAVVRLVILPLVEGTERTSGPHDGALAVLRERFARGDIDEEEFERRAEFLRRSREGE
jgi:putative membrane protein